MQRGFRNRFLSLVGTTTLVAIGSLFVAPGEAHAYSPEPVVYWVSQEADTPCVKISERPYPEPMTEHFTVQNLNPPIPRCWIRDNYGYNNIDAYPYDQGGQNLWIDLYRPSDDVSIEMPLETVQFQAYGEHLILTDYSDDSDTVYVWVNGHAYSACPCVGGQADENNFDLDLVDGNQYTIKITDDAAGSVLIASTGNGKLPYLYP